MRPLDCELANESPEHHLLKLKLKLKLKLAVAARAAGWRAELEVSSELRDWRADVLVFDEQGRPFMALEAQLSPMTPDEARMRTDRYARDGVAVCWVGLHGRPWERAVPALRVRAPAERGDPWTVRHGVARYTWTPRMVKGKAKWEHITCPLGDALAWILQGWVRVHTGVNGTVWWTAPAYEERALARARMEADAEAASQAAAAERRREESAAADRRRRAAEQRALNRQADLQERQAEMQRLTGFFQRTGFDLTAWDTFTQLVRSASGKAIVYGKIAAGTETASWSTPGHGGRTADTPWLPLSGLTPRRSPGGRRSSTSWSPTTPGSPASGPPPGCRCGSRYWTLARDAAPSNASTQSWIQSRDQTGPDGRTTPRA